MSADGSSLGERLRQLRVVGDVVGYRPLRVAAKSLGVDFPTLSQIEANRTKPDREVVARAAALYGGDLGELLRLLDEWQEAPPVDLSANICRKRWTP